MPKLEALNPFGQKIVVEFDVKPDACPLCHNAIDATQMNVAGIDGDAASSDTTLEIVYRCPRQRCARSFIAGYRQYSLGLRAVGPYQLRWLQPTAFKAPAFEPEIVEVSPQFAVIFGQAAQAESLHLDQIAGVGFRKALEFLVKDYCISEQPDQAEAIRSELLGQTISKRVSDPNVKQCASRAAWLGNDETHYERRWEGKDISDLKTLVQLTMNWIHNNVLTKRYLHEMPPPGKP